MNIVQKYNLNKDLYEKNKKEIITKLVSRDYSEGGRIIITSGIENYQINEFYLKRFQVESIDTLEKIFRYVIAYRFTED